MLVIVPYLVQHPGSELAEVAGLFDVPVDQLRRDLDLLFMSGLPPYGPGDLIEVDVDEDDRIWISMAAHFARPLRLTRSEALALYLRGTELLGDAGPARRRRRSRRRSTSCGRRSDPRRSAMPNGSRWRIPARRSEALEPIREAARERERVGIDYFAHSSGEWSTRVIDPEEVFVGARALVRGGVGRDGRRGAAVPRRPDPSRGADRRERFAPRGLEGAGRSLYTPTEDDVAVRSPPGARRRDGSPSTTRPRTGRSDQTGRSRSPCPRGRSAGSRGCCSGWGPTRPCSSHPS